MMPVSLGRVLLAVSDSLELSLIAKATVVLALALVATRAMPRARAAARHVVLAAAFGALLTLPAVAIVMPWFPVPIATGDPVDRERPRPVLVEVRLFQHLEALDAASVGGLAAPPSRTVGGMLRGAWAGIALVFLGPVGLTLLRLRALRRTGVPWLSGASQVRRLAIQAGIKRIVGVVLHERIASPLTCGVARPAIVLPSDAESCWSDAELRRAMVHELEHIRRLDWPVQLMARVACALYWFHPMVWMAWRQLCLDSERACDDAVMEHAEGTEYAAQLVTLAGRLSNRSLRPVLSMAGRSDLSARVAALLDGEQRRGRAGALMATSTIAATAIVLLVITPLHAVTTSQLTAPVGPTFDVASIKPNVSGDLRVSVQATPGGRYVATNAPVRTLIRDAYALEGFQLTGGPDWLDVDRFDIAARSDGNPTPADQRLMLRALLADRFKLRLHGEKRDASLYALVLARRDGILGPQLRRTGSDCAQTEPWSGTRPPPAGEPYSPCRAVGPGPGGGLRFRAITLSAFAKFLATPAQRPVVDSTGLAGTFDIDLALTTELGPPPPPPGVPDQVDRSAAPSIFTAIQEQLGLKLEPRRGPVEFLVIDHIERPSPNEP